MSEGGPTSDEMLARIDAATADLESACWHCGGPLGASASDDFCSDHCQAQWHAARTVPLLDYKEPYDLPQHFSNQHVGRGALSVRSDIPIPGRTSYFVPGGVRSPSGGEWSIDEWVGYTAYYAPVDGLNQVAVLTMTLNGVTRAYDRSGVDPLGLPFSAPAGVVDFGNHVMVNGTSFVVEAVSRNGPDVTLSLVREVADLRAA